jgi:hypothetical protein
MKKKKLLLLILFQLICYFPVNSQSSHIPWSSFSSSFGNSGTPSAKLITSAGEPFVGLSGNGNTRVISGFLTFSQTQITGLKNEPGLIPIVWKLEQNFPNPFNPSTTINYQISKPGLVTLKIYDILGREIATLINENKVAGFYEINFDASKLASGIYIYQLKSNNFVSSKKMILLK